MQREKNDVQASMEGDQEDMNELMKKHKAAVAQVAFPDLSKHCTQNHCLPYVKILQVGQHVHSLGPLHKPTTHCIMALVSSWMAVFLGLLFSESLSPQ